MLSTKVPGGSSISTKLKKESAARRITMYRILLAM